jgi:hypothetical protein
VDAATLSQMFGFTQRTLKANVEGLSHEDSLVQPPPGGNCANWILGHILFHRNVILDAMGEPRAWTDAGAARYDRGSEAITGEAEGVVRMEVLLELLGTSYDRLVVAIGRVDAERLEQPGPVRGTLGQWLSFLALHEMYHSGQLGLVRRIAGKEGAIR